jgi:hypothetical protein
MGNWTMHVSGHGVHDNGDPRDADVQLKEFVDKLLHAGHSVHRASITTGASKELVRDSEETPVSLRPGDHDYRTAP